MSTMAVAQKVCKIEGQIINRPKDKILLLAPKGTDYRVSKPIEIKINNDGTFSYSLNFEYPELYTLVFKSEYDNSAWYTYQFMLEEPVVKLEIYPHDRYADRKIVGGELNKHFQSIDIELANKYNEKLEPLSNKLYYELGEDAYSEEYKGFIRGIRQNKLTPIERDSLYRLQKYLVQNNMQFNEEGKVIEHKITEIRDNLHNEILNLVLSNNNEASLAMLGILVDRNNSTVNPTLNSKYKDVLYKHFTKDYADNPMYKRIELKILGGELKNGSDFIDFEAPDLDGNTHKLSGLIKNKVVVLDLWASWCGPCMHTTKSFIDVWEKYKDLGFDIIGVAREKDNTKAMEAAMKRIGMKWLNLVDINDKSEIWYKYGIGNAGGGVFLIDKHGKIVDIGFNAAQLDTLLEGLLK